MKSAILLTILLAAASLGQKQPVGTATLKPAVSVTETPLSAPDATGLVRITRIELADDSFEPIPARHTVVARLAIYFIAPISLRQGF